LAGGSRRIWRSDSGRRLWPPPISFSLVGEPDAVAPRAAITPIRTSRATAAAGGRNYQCETIFDNADLR